MGEVGKRSEVKGGKGRIREKEGGEEMRRNEKGRIVEGKGGDLHAM